MWTVTIALRWQSYRLRHVLLGVHWKCTTWKWRTVEILRRENARYENAGPQIAGLQVSLLHKITTSNTSIILRRCYPSNNISVLHYFWDTNTFRAYVIAVTLRNSSASLYDITVTTLVLDCRKETSLMAQSTCFRARYRPSPFRRLDQILS